MIHNCCEMTVMKKQREQFYGWGSPQREELYERVSALGKLRATALKPTRNSPTLISLAPAPAQDIRLPSLPQRNPRLLQVPKTLLQQLLMSRSDQDKHVRGEVEA